MRAWRRIGGLAHLSTRSHSSGDKLSGPLSWGYSYLVAPNPILFCGTKLGTLLMALGPMCLPMCGRMYERRLMSTMKGIMVKCVLCVA